MRIDSFIATLATGSLIAALITMLTGGTAIISTRLQGGFAKIGQTNVSGFTLPVVYVFLVAVAMWFLLEHTATGRRLYATGFNPDASKLAGVRVDRLRFASLVVSGSLAGATGLVLASTVGSGDPSAGTSYLLPAFAAAFLGATQLKHGRFNAFGTLIAVLLLGTGTTGLALANAPQWSADMFVGLVLIASLAVTGIQRRASVGDGGRFRTCSAACKRAAADMSFTRRYAPTVPNPHPHQEETIVMSRLTPARSRIRRAAGVAASAAMVAIVAAGCGSSSSSSGSASGSVKQRESHRRSAGRVAGDAAARNHHGHEAGRQGSAQR